MSKSETQPHRLRPNILGPIVDGLAHLQTLHMHQEENALDQYVHWLQGGGSLINVFANHRSIWEFNIMNEQSTQPLIERAGIQPHHFVFASIKFNETGESNLPTMGQASQALTDYCAHRDIEILYTMPDKLRTKWQEEIESGKLTPEDIEKRKHWMEYGDRVNGQALYRLAEALQNRQTVTDIFIEGTRNNGTLLRAEKILDGLNLLIRKKKQLFDQSRVPKIATFILSNFIDIQGRNDQEHALKGLRLFRNVHALALPPTTLDDLVTSRGRFKWSENATAIRDKTIYAADILLRKVAQRLNGFQRGVYNELIEIN